MTPRRWFALAYAAFAGAVIVVVGSKGGLSMWFAAGCNVVVYVFGQMLCHSVDDLSEHVNELLDSLKRERGE